VKLSLDEIYDAQFVPDYWTERDVMAKVARWKTLKDCCDKLPESAGCYCFIENGVLVYVGSTVNLARRFNAYTLRPGLSNATTFTNIGTFQNLVIKYKPSVRCGDWAMTEIRLICRYKPRLNVNRYGVK